MQTNKYTSSLILMFFYHAKAEAACCSYIMFPVLVFKEMVGFCHSELRTLDVWVRFEVIFVPVSEQFCVNHGKRLCV